MSRALRLEDFGQPAAPGAAPPPFAAPPFNPPAFVEPPPPPPAPEPPAEGDGAGLEAFEQGYRNGWDDCIAHETEERRRIGADLAAGLAGVAVTADAVREEILAGLAPLFEQIAGQLLPAVAAEALAPLLADELGRIAAEQAAPEIRMLAAPSACPAIERLVAGMPGLAVAIVPEPAFAEGQVSLRFAGQRRDIDLGEAVDRMTEAIRGFASGIGRPRAGTGHETFPMQSKGVA
jgi:hypothetical protein